ncbi:alpha-glucosidase [Fontibacillus solani]|uniref:Alpha-glucosidase n=1 Tax=Fontibacillus solani TaxID=1572857 RepID=A0A7W3SXZ3_9BACL|nr:TIM-barrel domain-containing protein [Fontibacillus solani]MBA9088291.1 alpha-glucosidase [Fontibacillus solani]
MQTSEKIHPDQIESESISIYRDIGPYKGYECRDKYVMIYSEHANLTVKLVTPGIVRISVSLEGRDAELEPSKALLPYEPLEGWNVIERNNELEITGGNIVLVVDIAALSFYVKTGQGTLCGSYKLSFSDTAVRCQGSMDDEAMIYGLGETTGYLNKRGERYTMWNSDVFDPHVPDMESLYQSIPLLINHASDNTFGLFIDNPGRTVVDLREALDSYFIETASGEMDLYFITGPGFKDVVTNYSILTGTMPLPPLWSLGYQQSRFSYMNQEEVIQLAHNFRSKGIPCDVIYLDIHYMDDYKVFTFDMDRFPDPAAMMSELKELGFRIVPVVDPGVKVQNGYEVYEQGIEEGRFCQTPDGKEYVGAVWPGPSVFPDFTDEVTREWWGALHQFYVDYGISGIWNDMNEPSVFNSPTKTMDDNVIHRNDGNPKTHGEMHNIYSLLMSQATYEGMEKLLQGERPFVLTRAGYAGIQRYATVWTGDNRSYWDHMRLSMSMGLNLGLSGVAFCGADIGGFMHHASGELLARWTQLGVFTPFCRNHSAMDTRNQEPWTFNDEVEEICRKYIEFRYRMLPYLYSLFYDSTCTGLPIMRPLVLEYPKDRNTYHLSDQFLLGKDLLVAPIYEPGKQHRVVYLPEGIWFDYWTGTRYEGGAHIIAHAPLDVLPLYIRAGAILPQTQLMQHTGQAIWQELDIHLYTQGATSAFTLYEDDGLSDRYAQGAYNLIQISTEENDRRYTISAAYEVCGLQQDDKSILFTVHHLSFIPKSVNLISEVPEMKHLEEQSFGWYYDKQDNQLYIKTQLAGLQEVEIIVEG